MDRCGTHSDAFAAGHAPAQDRFRRLELALEASGMSLWAWDPRTDSMTWSEPRLGHLPPASPSTYGAWAERVHPNDLPSVEATLHEAIRAGTACRCDHRIVLSGGAVRWMEFRGQAYYDTSGACVSVLGLVSDVTARKETEQALHASEKRYRTVVESQTELVCRYLPDTTLTFVNEAYCRFFGRSRETLVGRKFLELVPHASHPSVLREIESVCREQRQRTYEHAVLLADGTTGWQQWVDTPIDSPDGGVAELQATGRDITDLKRTEQSLRESNERFQCVLRATQDVILDWDMSVDRIWWSANGEQLLGGGPDDGHYTMAWWLARIHAGERERVAADFKTALDCGAELWEAEYRLCGRHGRVTHVCQRAFVVRDTLGRPRRLIGSLMDITDRSRLEETNRRLVHATRLAIVGELTASIAHEMNQPLSAISWNAQASAAWLRADRAVPLEELRQALEDIRADALRAGQVIRKLRGLLQDNRFELRPLDLNEVTAEAVRLLRTETMRRQVAIETAFQAVPTVLGDRVQLQQVLLNLLVNSMDALADAAAANRRVIVSTARTATGMVELRVADAGCGIPQDSLPRLFESFFTTKGRGMGLGLSIARSIVEAHGGWIWARNNGAEPGATFGFELPASGAV